ncbi:hypothetical protein ADS78_13005, partial [Idiomarina abyssalis]
IAQTERDGDSIERVVREGQVHTVTRCLRNRAALAGFQHANGEVRGNTPGAGLGQFNSGDGGSRGKIEDAFPRP